MKINGSLLDLKSEIRPPGGADWKWNLETMKLASLHQFRLHDAMEALCWRFFLRDYLNAAIYIANVSWYMTANLKWVD